MVSIISLEYLSRRCKQQSVTARLSCPFHDDKVYNNYSGEEGGIMAEGRTIEAILQNSVVYVNREEIGGANGRACNGFAYVANDLPGGAKRYVALHEAIHLTGITDEMKTNYLAAKEEPVGLFQTVFYSVYLNFRDHSFFCALGECGVCLKFIF